MWQETDNNLYAKIEFDGFEQAIDFIDKIAHAARRANHHPKITIDYNVVELWLTSHSAGNKVTERDWQLAEKIEDILAGRHGNVDNGLSVAKLYADGGSRGNPGPSALGFAILDMENNVVKKEGVYLGVTTNNQAEYRALKMGLESAMDLGVKELHVYMDSLLVINQVQGIWKIKNAELMPLHQEIRGMLQKFDKVVLTHVPRALNKIADGMVNECLDSIEDDAAVIR
jgi:ribonuclease HI/pterin-4a-carbinolamine dehydratase